MPNIVCGEASPKPCRRTYDDLPEAQVGYDGKRSQWLAFDVESRQNFIGFICFRNSRHCDALSVSLLYR